MANYYSQHGEDFLLDKMFAGQTGGFFVEVGCIDGLRFSNTLSFEERGWTGICVEAHADYIEALRKNRPGSIVVHAAAGESDDEDVTFYANSRGSLSTLDRGREEHFKNYGEHFQGFVEQKVSKCRLDTVFDRHAVTGIDILSLDIEGYELQAIAGLNLHRYRPRVLVIELDSSEEERAMDKILVDDGGYRKSVRLGANVYYVDDERLDRAVRHRRFEVELIHTPHVLDGGDREHRVVTIDTRPRSWFSKLGRLVGKA